MATSIAKTLILVVVVAAPDPLVYASSQQVPQLGEFQPATANAPPMRGKRGREPKVVKLRVRSPFGPSEQATDAREPDRLS